jgi:diacylglycerol kinase (ATP)
VSASPFGPMRIIANPAAGSGKDGVLPRLTKALSGRGLDHDVAVTTRRRHATDLALAAVDDGFRFVVAVGGDGTVHEVVNGLLDPETGPRTDGVVLGIVPAGSGGDFVRTFGLHLTPEKAVRRLEGDGVFPVDVGRIRLTGLDGGERTVLFANIAEVGYGAVVAARAERLPRFLGRVRYLFAIFAAIRTFGREEAEVGLERFTASGEYSNVVVANGQFFGGGMRVAPTASPDDGLFHVQLWGGTVKDVFLLTNKIRRGEHRSHPEIEERRSSTVTVRTAQPVLVEADGEVLGTSPATFDLLPRALNLKI